MFYLNWTYFEKKKRACHTASMQTHLADQVKNPIASKCRQQSVKENKTKNEPIQ